MLLRNVVVAGGLVAFVGSVYLYTIKRMSKDDFADVEVEDRLAREAKARAASATAKTQ